MAATGKLPLEQLQQGFGNETLNAQQGDMVTIFIYDLEKISAG